MYLETNHQLRFFFGRGAGTDDKSLFYNRKLGYPLPLDAQHDKAELISHHPGAFTPFHYITTSKHRFGLPGRKITIRQNFVNQVSYTFIILSFLHVILSVAKDLYYQSHFNCGITCISIVLFYHAQKHWPVLEPNTLISW